MTAARKRPEGTPEPPAWMLALGLLNKIQAASEARNVEEASGFVAVCFDPETGRSSFHGPFDEVVEALAYADDFEARLNSGLGGDELPYQVTVHPILPPP